MIDALVQYIAGLIVALAAMTLAHFGMDVRPAHRAPRDVHRLADCDHRPSSGRSLIESAHRDC